jgi:hypothetical protein
MTKLFDDVPPLPSETQIRTDGLHVSSYSTDDDGLPYLSPSARPVLRQALRDKQRLETSPPCWKRKTSCDETSEPMEVIQSFDGGDVRLAFDVVLLPWALEHDPEAARIIQAVIAKAAAAPVQLTVSSSPKPKPLTRSRPRAVMVTFHRTASGFTQDGEPDSDTGFLEWLRDDGTWDGGWVAEPVVDLIARMQRSGPYKYSTYRILAADKVPLEIKSTCFSCGMIAGIACGRDSPVHPRGDSLIDFDEDHQYSISLPVVTKGKNYGKHKVKPVTFNSMLCGNLALLELTRTESSKEVISYDYETQDLGEYRAAQGWKRCPTCKRLNTGNQFCDDACKDKYEGDIQAVLQVAQTIRPASEPTYRGRCAYRPCGKGKDARGLRVRARVPKVGDFCSTGCRDAHRQVQKRKEAKKAASGGSISVAA